MHRLAALARKGTKLLLAGLWLAGLAPTQAVPSPAPPTQNHFIRVWQSADGLPEGAINAVVQNREGYLWLGTYSGLVRFDGVRFTVFAPDHTPELASSRITSLFEDRQGRLWIGHETGQLTCWQDGRFHPVAVRAAWSGGKIAAMAEDAAGQIWLVNERGLLARLSDGLVLTPETSVATDASVATLAHNARGEVWVARGGSVAKVQAGKLLPLKVPSQLPRPYVEGLATSADGGLWIISEGRVRKLQGHTWVQDLGPRPWGDDAITAVLETREGALAVGTLESGLFLLRTNGESLHVDRTNGLSQGWVRCLAEDREGNLWIGTRNGLNTLRVGKVATVLGPDHWQNRAVMALAAGPEGTLWVGTEGAGLYRWAAGQWTRFGPAQGLAKPFIWSLATDMAGRLWAGTWESGLYHQTAAGFEPAPGLGTLTSPVTALALGAESELWVGTGRGLCRYLDGQATWFGQGVGLSLPDVRAILRTRDGTIWLGLLGGGLARLKDGGLRQYRQADGLASDFVQCLREDQAGALWLGTAGGGLNRFKDGHFARVGHQQGLPDNIICHIEDDGRGYFWMSSHAGIFRVSQTELIQCAEGRLTQVHCLTYGLGDGLPSLECSGGFQSAGCQTADGRLWFPTIDGLVALDPKEVKTNRLAPPVLIEEVVVDGQKHLLPPFSADLSLGRGKHQVEFRYTGLSFVVPEKVRFKYRLEGLEDHWMEAGARRSATYSYLPPGHYRFEVTACNEDGVWNATGASLAVAAPPQFWQTWWFEGLCVAAGLGMTGGGVWWRMRRHMHRKLERLERQRALERERARIAQDIHDEIGASLTRITLLSQSARKDRPPAAGSETNLERIYTTARELTRAMDEIVWAVNPRHDSLNSLADYLARFANDFLAPANINCQLDLPLHLPAWPLAAELRHNLFLAFKEALHNIIKHSGATEVRVSLELAPGGFSLMVQDNGRGFEPAAPPAGAPGQPDRLAGGNGLHNMRRRLEEIGGTFELQSAPGQGARLSFGLKVAAEARGPDPERPTVI